MKKILSFLLLLFPNTYYTVSHSSEYHTTILSGGCFWCTEADIEKVNGVIEVVSGYAGGTEKNPTYHQVASGKTSHREAVKIIYDSKIITYEEILDTYLRTIDPTDGTGSFVDRGRHYTAAIFTFSKEQEKIAASFIDKIKKSSYFNNKDIFIPILSFTTFYRAEDYHQDYYKKNNLQYSFYRFKSGRDQYIEKVWKKIPKDFFF